jgi:transcriptional regulator with XRE-family HTH domain
MAIEDKTGIKEIVARNVRNRRDQLKLSQEGLAHEAKIDRTYVSQVERRIRNVTITMLARLATALKTTPEQLLVPGHFAEMATRRSKQTKPKTR